MDDDPSVQDVAMGARERRGRRHNIDADGYRSDSSGADGVDGGEDIDDDDDDGGDGSDDGGGDNNGGDDADGRDGGREPKQAADSDHALPHGASRKRKRKGVRFLEASEIEGQELNPSMSDLSYHRQANVKGKRREEQDDDVDDDDDDDDDDDEAARLDDDVPDEEVGAGGKKRHAPKLDAFNMEQEMEEGQFDDAGNFVRRTADPDAHQDVWLDGVRRRDIREARAARERQEQRLRAEMRRDRGLSTGDVLQGLLPLLEPGESVLECLQRLGALLPKKARKHQGRGADTPAQAAARETIDTVTGLAAKLMERGFDDVYDDSREALMRLYTKETGAEWANNADNNVEHDLADLMSSDDEKDEAQDTLWEYKWEGADTVYGAYPAATMQAWAKQGFFSTAQKALLRPANTAGADFCPAERVPLVASYL